MFRLHGLQRSGTNLIEGLMYRYFEVWCRNGGSGPRWKHSLEMEDLDTDLFYVVIAKNPYLWVESIAFRNPMDYIETQKMFPATESTTPELTAGPRSINIVNAAKTWNQFYCNWNTAGSNRVVEIRYEDLLDRQLRQDILDYIKMAFDCKWREDPERYKSRETSILDKDLSSDKIKYYASGKPKYLSQTQIDAITENIDRKLFEVFDYQIL